MADEHHDDNIDEMIPEEAMKKAFPGDEQHDRILKLVKAMEAVLVGSADPKNAPPLADCYNAICVLIARASVQSGDPDYTFALIGKMAMHNMEALLDAEEDEAAKTKLN